MTMASQSRDGDVIAGFLYWWGYRAVRGSSSRGGSEALAGMVEALRGTTRWAALTPDGPRGPARRVQDGGPAPRRGAGRADHAGRHLVEARPRFLRSWDRYLVPMPFSRCAVVFGEGAAA